MNLNQVTVPCLNLEQSVSFYQKLGLNLIVHAPPYYARFECPAGDSTFSLHQVEVLPQGVGPSVYFECEDLDGQVRALHSLGVEFEHGPKDQTWLWREARLKDPDGNQLILFHGGVNRKNPPWRVK